MNSDEKKKNPRIRVGLILLFFGCWVARFLGPFSLLIIPFLFLGFWIAWEKKSKIAFVLLFLLNPLGLYFTHGVIDYIGGAPTLMYSGHARMRKWNVDRYSRAFRVGGMSVVSGNEWTWQIPHNAAIRFMCFAFGPPRKSYHGPFPSFDEAISMTETGERISYSELLQGHFMLESGFIHLGPDFGLALTEQFSSLYFSTLIQDRSRFRHYIHCKMIDERCLLIRLIAKSLNRNSKWETDLDCLVFVDLEVARPFAYWPIVGASNIGGPSFTYLPGMGRDRSKNSLHGSIEHSKKPL